MRTALRRSPSVARPSAPPSFARRGRRRATAPLRSCALVVFAAALALAGLGLSPGAVGAQEEEDPARRPSPIGIAKAEIGDAYVKVTYGRPYVRGRAIFGADTTHLVPFDRVWRTGANEATEITFTRPLVVNGTRLDAGTYAIFTVPGAERWEVRLSPQLGLDGTGWLDPVTGEFTADVYDASRDVAVFTVPVHETEEVVDPLTLVFEPTSTGADLVLRWERTEVRIPMEPAAP